MKRETLQRFVKAHDRVAKLEQQLAEAKGERKEADDELRSEFEHDGVNNVKTKDGRTIYLNRALRVSAKDGATYLVRQALLDLGLGEFTTESYNAAQVAAFVREQEKLGLKLPQELADNLTIFEQFSLRVVGHS